MTKAFADVNGLPPPVKAHAAIHPPPIEFPEEDLDLRPPLPSLAELMANKGHLLVTMVLKEMPYTEYLKTGHWQAVRRKALAAAGHRCQICLSQCRLDVHHIDEKYRSKGEEKPEDVIALCHGPNGCHKKQHETLALVARAEGEKRFRK